MRSLLLAAVVFTSLSSSAQYYYKDIVGIKESSDIIKTYMKTKVTRVLVTSFDAENVKNDDFKVQQEFSSSEGVLKTTTQTTPENATTLFTYVDANGNVTRTMETNGSVTSSSEYTYDASGNLTSIISTSSDSTITEKELHLWQWNDGTPVRMLRIKNEKDTAVVDFVLDENGNVIEEVETRRKSRSRPVYYYYNENNQLTDVVRYNERAGQLLPEYMFEYSPSNQVIQKITVPANNSDYLIWRYLFNAQGLKTKEAIYSKHDKKTPIGRIEYQYSFGQ